MNVTGIAAILFEVFFFLRVFGVFLEKNRSTENADRSNWCGVVPGNRQAPIG
jgi:hypothetical protein